MLAVLAAGGVLLVLAAFAAGRLVADDPAPAEDGSAPAAEGASEAAPYEGAVTTLRPTGGTATCQAGDSVDEAGNPVSYPPWQVFDADLSTAWRCDGPGTGERLTLTLPDGARVAEVGLVPGYAKTDPASGADRYAENNLITRVRWIFEDGSRYVQRMKADPDDRSMRTMRVPETESDRVVLEILASRAGARNTIAVSEVRVGGPAG